MTQHFAICTFRATGPIKSFSELQAAHIHNARTKPIAHGISGRPTPVHLMGSGDLVADVKHKLRIHDLDPNRLRKNGVIAYEAVLTASPAFFRQGNEDERTRRLKDWTNAQVQFAWGRYRDRIASMVLHLDEETPHAHLVVVPLSLVVDRRRRERRPQWSLVGATISGPGKFDELQDDYAAAMARFGLVRGERGSGQKNEPPGVFMRRLEAGRKAVEERERIAVEAQEEAEAIKSALSRVLASARSFVSAAKTLRNEDLSPAARAAFQAVLGLKREAEAIQLPANDPSEATQAAFFAIQQQARAIGR